MISRALRFCDSRLQAYDGMHNSFALIFLCTNAVFHAFIIGEAPDYVSYVYFFSSVMCITLLTLETWPQKAKKYYSLFWYVSIFTAVPLLYSFEFFSKTIDTSTTIIMVMSLFILGILADWLMFIIMLLAAIFLSTTTLYLFDKEKIINFLNSSNLTLNMLALTGMVVICVLFLRMKQIGLDSRFRIAKNIAGILSHEIKTPLASMRLILEDITEEIKYLDNNISIVQKFNKLSNIEKDISEFIGSTLVKVQDERLMNYQELSLTHEINSIIESYKLSGSEDFDVEVSIKQDFNFIGDQFLFRHVIYNLLKNSLDCKKIKPETTIKIYNKHSFYDNCFIFEDTGIGVDKHNINKIFNSFFTTKATGSGLGLFFCKNFIEKFGGNIVCESEKNKYTRFKIYFPRIDTHE